MKKVLVAGATGYLGRHVAEEFNRRNYYVRALARTPEKLSDLEDILDDVFIGQATDPRSLENVCRDVDIVFSSIGITRQKDRLTYKDVDFQGNMNLLEQAGKSGVSKFIYICVFNAEKLQHLKIVAAKQAFVRELKRSGIDATVIYPNGFFSDMLEILEMARKGRGYLLGDGHTKGNPIHGADLAKVCVDAATSDESDIHIGGPDTFTQKEILELAFKILNKPLKITAIPLWAIKAILFLLRTLTTEKVYGPLEFFLTVMAMDMVAPSHGDHHLADFFQSHVEKAGTSNGL